MQHSTLPGLRYTCLVLLCWWGSATAALEVIDLHSRPAAEIIPVVQPLLEPGTVLSGDGFQVGS